MDQRSHTVVIGAGIVGVATAVWLKRFGCEVTLIDKAKPGMGASFGNACLLASCACIPVTTPGLISKAPSYVFDKNSPLFLRWRYFPKLLPFLIRYLSYANEADTRRIAKGVNYITHDSVVQHQALAGNGKAAEWIQQRPYAFAYKDRAAFAKDEFTWELRKEFGFIPEILEEEAVHEYQPALARDLRLLAIVSNHGFILNPKEYIDALVEMFREMGGKFVHSGVENFAWRGERVSGVITKEGVLPCDHVVLTTGAHSKKFMKQLGLNVPLEAERGYHILYKKPNISPTIPIMISSGKFVASPMNQGLRCAGTIEFGGLGNALSPAPLAFIRKSVAQAFPKLEAEAEEEWLGHRPATPDSMPLIGEVRNTGVIAGFGHQHIGLTAGAKTGRIIAGMLCGKPIEGDLRPYDANRFSS